MLGSCRSDNPWNYVGNNKGIFRFFLVILEDKREYLIALKRDQIQCAMDPEAWIRKTDKNGIIVENKSGGTIGNDSSIEDRCN